jgi:hypothetical protein
MKTCRDAEQVMVLRLSGIAAAAILVATGATAHAAGLAPVQLGAYYQPETVNVNPVEKQWTLPLAWQSIPTAPRVRAVLGLSTNASAALERHGFVVVPFGKGTNIIEPYTTLRELGFPAFVTSDTLLHLYHVQFDDILKCVETNEFLPKLVSMTSALLDEALRQRSVFSGDLREAADRNAAFLTVAVRLLEQPHAVPPEVMTVATAELQLITAHAGFNDSPIFKYKEDYSQYVPRGHYTRSKALERYFKTMMWYGRMAFLLKGSLNYGPSGEALVSPQDARVQTLQAVLLALGLDRLEAAGQPIADTWNRIYGVTAFFVGLADDLTPYEYKEAVLKLFGTSVDPVELDDDQALFELKKELASLHNPQIYGGTGNAEVPPNPTPEDLDRVLDKTKGMRVMGQRFIPDSYMFQRLVLPVTGPFVGSGKPFTMEVTQAGPQRCFPRGLDVMAVLGSRLALNIMDKEGDTTYLGYDASMNELTQHFDNLNEVDWHRNLYWSWLYALKALIAPPAVGCPPFMQTPAWEAKQLNTALASWTELRHDTILYAKQSYTPEPTSVPPEPDSGYVEPVPEFYQRLLALTRLTRTGLDDLHVLNGVQRDRLVVLENLLINLREIALAELESRPLSITQKELLARFDQALAPLTNGIPEGLDSSTVLVADVHTDGNTSRVLEEGVGYVKLLVAAYPLPDGGVTLGAGPVMSYYEFKWPMSDRLTDEKWAALLENGQQPAEPEWTKLFAAPATLPAEDADGNRLADGWETQYWASTGAGGDYRADADGDGLTNLQEATAGTDPVNAGSALRMLSAARKTGSVELRWQSIPGRVYRVRCSEDLLSWRLLGEPVTATAATATLADLSPDSGSSRFYRVEVIP